MYAPDLTPLADARDKAIGLAPLAVGFLRGDKPFPTGAVPDDFLVALRPFAYPRHSLAGGRHDGRCALSRDCPRRLRPLPDGDDPEDIVAFDGQLRVIGDDAVYAAPAMILHYITDHNYQPPSEFVDAVRHGPGPGSGEHRALIRTLQRMSP